MMAASRRCAIHLLNETPEPCHETRFVTPWRGFNFSSIHALYEILLVNKKNVMCNNILNCFDRGLNPLRIENIISLSHNGTGISRKNFSLEFKFIRLTSTLPSFRSDRVASRVINRDLAPEKHGLKRMIMRIDGHASTTLREPPRGLSGARR